MRLDSRTAEWVVFRMSVAERKALRTCLHLAGDWDRAVGPLARGDASRLPEESESDLAAAIISRRRESMAEVRSCLGDGGPWHEAGPGELVWRLQPGQVDLVLRTMNHLRLAAWERLGSPDLDAEEPFPELDDSTLPPVWVMEVTGRVLSVLIPALSPEV